VAGGRRGLVPSLVDLGVDSSSHSDCWLDGPHTGSSHTIGSSVAAVAVAVAEAAAWVLILSFICNMKKCSI